MWILWWCNGMSAKDPSISLGKVPHLVPNSPLPPLESMGEMACIQIHHAFPPTNWYSWNWMHTCIHVRTSLQPCHVYITLSLCMYHNAFFSVVKLMIRNICKFLVFPQPPTPQMMTHNYTLVVHIYIYVCICVQLNLIFSLLLWGIWAHSTTIDKWQGDVLHALFIKVEEMWPCKL